MLRVGVALAFRRARLQHVYSVLRGKDLETGDVSAERRTEQFERLAARPGEGARPGNWHEFLKCLQAAGLPQPADDLVGERRPLQLRAVADRAHRLRHRPADAAHRHRPLVLHGPHDRPLHLVAGERARVRPGPDRRPPDRRLGCASSPSSNGSSRPTSPTTTGRSRSRTASTPRRPGRPSCSRTWPRSTCSTPRSSSATCGSATCSIPDVTAPRAIERHHLFPKKYLASIGVTGTRQTNAIANMAFLDWAENAKISAQSPADLLAGDDRRAWPRPPASAEPRACPAGRLGAAGLPDVPRQAARPHRAGDPGGVRVPAGRDESARTLSRRGPRSRPARARRSSSSPAARYNAHTQEADPKLEHVIVKTVCGFLNAEGGTLFIGVDDDGHPVGIEPTSRRSKSKANMDGYELFLTPTA